MSADDCLYDAILADAPDLYWPANDVSNVVAADFGGANDGTYTNIDAERRRGPACGCWPNTAHVWHADRPSVLELGPNPIDSTVAAGRSVAFEIWFLAFDTPHNNTETTSIYANVTEEPTSFANSDPWHESRVPFFLRRHPDGTYDFSLSGIPQPSAPDRIITLGEWHQWGYQRGVVGIGGFPGVTEGGGEWFDGGFGYSWGGGRPADFNGGGSPPWTPTGPPGSIHVGSGDPECEPFDGLIAAVAWWWNGGGPDLAHHWSLACKPGGWSVGAVQIRPSRTSAGIVG